jgi:hypothetical protein
MSTYKTKDQRIRNNSSQFQVCSLGIPCALLALKKSTLGDNMCWGGGGGGVWGSEFFYSQNFCQILTYTKGFFSVHKMTQHGQILIFFFPFFPAKKKKLINFFLVIHGVFQKMKCVHPISGGKIRLENCALQIY